MKKKNYCLPGAAVKLFLGLSCVAFTLSLLLYAFEEYYHNERYLTYLLNANERPSSTEGGMGPRTLMRVPLTKEIES